jgi:hypothetical protein
MIWLWTWALETPRSGLGTRNHAPVGDLPSPASGVMAIMLLCVAFFVGYQRSVAWQVKGLMILS